MKKHIILPALVVVCLCTASAKATEVTVTIEALIDGRDHLILDKNTMQWHHFDFAAVGRHWGLNEPTIITAVVDGVLSVDRETWIPQWPEDPPAEIRYNAYSSVLPNPVPVPAQLGITDATVTKLQGRGSVDLQKIPAGSNDHRLIVEFNDNPPSSHEWYEVQLDLTMIPEPTTVALLAVGSLVLLRKRGAWWPPDSAASALAPSSLFPPTKTQRTIATAESRAVSIPLTALSFSHTGNVSRSTIWQKYRRVLKPKMPF